jgi:hypothetical protein
VQIEGQALSLKYKLKFMRYLFATLLVFFVYTHMHAQVMNPYGPAPKNYDEEEKEEKLKKGFDPNRLVFGGNLNVSFGDFTFINISPQVGYQFSNMVTAGAGINYINTGITYRDVGGNKIYKESFSYAGMNLFGRFFPTNFLFLMAQPEINYSWGQVKFFNSQEPNLKLNSAWVPTFLVGGGLMLGGQGGRGGFMLSLQYDLAQDPRSPYGTAPFFGMGYAF